jgi:hypothetical protein
MNAHLAHSSALRIVGSARAHTVAWLVAALLLAAATTALLLAISSGGSTASNGPSVSAASVHGNFEFPPAERISATAGSGTPSGKYLYP